LQKKDSRRAGSLHLIKGSNSRQLPRLLPGREFPALRESDLPLEGAAGRAAGWLLPLLRYTAGALAFGLDGLLYEREGAGCDGRLEAPEGAGRL
jgi:hypothetical protein